MLFSVAGSAYDLNTCPFLEQKANFKTTFKCLQNSYIIAHVLLWLLSNNFWKMLESIKFTFILNKKKSN